MKKYIILSILISLIPDMTHAATEYATFESFYKESSSINWVLAAVVALIAGAVIAFSLGAASPVVAGIGSWLGGMMGLSGAAATNAGLALLGGGSIAAGGFGIAGGAALLTAALSFGTDIVFDYTAGKAMSEYEYNNLVEQSKNMLTLPLPVNDSGPDAYEGAIELLKGIDKKSAIFLNSNQKLINRAIRMIETNSEVLDVDEKSKNDSMLSLLYFISNDYVMAKKYAEVAIKDARSSEIRRTLPAFIYATSSLYEEDFDFAYVTNNYLSYSVLAESDNKLIPLLFSIYLDRMSLRFNDNYLDGISLGHVFNVMMSPSLENMRVQNYTILLSRYFMQLKLEQQKISSLAGTSNDTIKESPETLMTVNDSLNRYNILLKGSVYVMSKYILLKLDDDSKLKAIEFDALLGNYIKDKERLESLVSELEIYQGKLSQSDGGKIDSDKGDGDNWSLNIIITVLMVIGLFIVIGAYKKMRHRAK